MLAEFEAAAAVVPCRTSTSGINSSGTDGNAGVDIGTGRTIKYSEDMPW